MENTEGRLVASLKSIIFGMLLFGVFAISMIVGFTQLGYYNDAHQTIMDNPAISGFSGDINDTLGGALENSESAEESLEQSPITLSGTDVFFDAMKNLWRSITIIPKLVYNLTIGLIIATIGGGNALGLILGITGAILLLSIVFGVWKLIKTGDSD